MTRDVTFTIGFDEALLLSDMLHGFEQQLSGVFVKTAVPVSDAAEQLALLRLHGAFERTLVELFAAEYNDLVRTARQRLTEQVCAF